MDEQTTINTENEMKPPQPTITIYLHSENEIKNKKARIVIHTHTQMAYRNKTRSKTEQHRFDGERRSNKSTHFILGHRNIVKL